MWSTCQRCVETPGLVTGLAAARSPGSQKNAISRERHVRRDPFFHARFFLEMAVRYSDLKVPPRPLPSGYAALLYLFGLS
jgi:hypothetical protein